MWLGRCMIQEFLPTATLGQHIAICQLTMDAVAYRRSEHTFLSHLKLQVEQLASTDSDGVILTYSTRILQHHWHLHRLRAVPALRFLLGIREKTCRPVTARPAIRTKSGRPERVRSSRILYVCTQAEEQQKREFPCSSRRRASDADE